MTAAATAIANAKLADNWADHAIKVIERASDMANWIVVNRYHLHKCDQANAAAFQRVKAAIAKRWDEIDRVPQ